MIQVPDLWTVEQKKKKKKKKEVVNGPNGPSLKALQSKLHDRPKWCPQDGWSRFTKRAVMMVVNKKDDLPWTLNQDHT